MTLVELRNYIDGLRFTITEEDVIRHDNEYDGKPGFTNKNGYSSRENVDSEYLEEHLGDTLKGVSKIIETPIKFYSDILISPFLLDFKEINTKWFNLKHDYLRYFEARNKGYLTHFCFYRTNRERKNNLPIKILPNTELTVEFLCIVDVQTLFTSPIRNNRIDVYDVMERCKNSENCVL